VANVKAAAVLARIKFIKERYGDPGYARVLEALERRTRERLSALVLSQEWLPLSCMTELIDVTDRVLGSGDGALCREMARYAADANLTTLYRIFFRISSASFVLSKASALWNVHYDSGRLESAEAGMKTIALRIADFDTPHCTHCRSVFAWAERSVELSGGKDVKVTYSGCRKRGGGACECTLTYQ
jgi:hypothetical protein